MPFIMLMILTLLVAQPAPAFTSNWQYKIKKDKDDKKFVETVRNTMLVANPGTKYELHIDIRSSCQKLVGNEGDYGQCSHELQFNNHLPSITIKKGEYIGLVRMGITNDKFIDDQGFSQSIFDPILGAGSNGCCGSMSITTLYNLQGKYLGFLRANIGFDSLMDRLWNFDNVAEGKTAMVLGNDPQGPIPKYLVLAYESPGKYREEKAEVKISDKYKNCEDWMISKFTQSASDEMALTLKDSHCGKTIDGPCNRKAKSWTCDLKNEVKY